MLAQPADFQSRPGVAREIARSYDAHNSTIPRLAACGQKWNMDDLDLIAACKQIYAQTNDTYNRYRQQLGASDFGFKILYGPPRLNAPVLFIGDQPGGKVADEKPNERSGWPSRCEYATETWTLARNMQNMFGSTFLMDCVGLNANFFRAPNSESWGVVPKSIRDILEKFCSVKLVAMISAMAPKQIITIGFSTLNKFGPSDPILYGTKNRVLMRRGNIGQWPAASTLHLSGAQLARDDRLAIANAILELTKQGSISMVASKSIVARHESAPPNAPNRLANRNIDTRSAPSERFGMVDPKVTLELLDELVKLGLTNEAFRRLHHSHDTIHGFRQWCVKTTNFVADGNNARVHERLKYVWKEYCERGLPHGGFIELSERAFAKIPPIPADR